jgi:C-terminal processing protease CtpA/Prc
VNPGVEFVRRHLLSLAPATVLLLAAASPLSATPEADRLAALARVWATARYLDPAVAFGDVDWDAALLRAILRVRASTSDDELARTISSMLDELHDPATRVVRHPAGAKETKRSDAPLLRWDGDVLIVEVGPYASSHDATTAWREMRGLDQELRKAKAALFDVRFHPEDPDDDGLVAEAVSSLSGLSTAPLAAPPRQYVFHSGYRPQEGLTSGGYFSGLLSRPGASTPPSEGGAPEKVAFVTDGGSRLPDVAVALRQAGHGLIVSSEPIDEGATAETRTVALPGPWRCRIRIATGDSIGADLISPDPMPEALAILQGRKPAPSRPAPPGATTAALAPRWRPDATYAEMTYPDVEHRILAAFRIWSVIDFFYPYKALIGDWDSVLPEALPRFVAANDADEYATAVLAMVARVEDGHTFAVGHPSAEKIFGAAVPPLGVRLVEDEFVVTSLRDEMPKDVALKVGDVVRSVDGEPFRARVERLRPLLTASTERARVSRLAAAALRGPKGSEAVLEVSGADGASRTIRVPRSLSPLAPPPSGGPPPYRVLEGHIGYVDMTRLKLAEVDAMFDALGGTRAIIFDIRGYPNGTVWAIAPRINTRGAKVGAVFRRAQVSGAADVEESSGGYYFEQPLPKSDKPKYAGRTVALIDDRAISQAEHTCLFFEAASGTTFIGSPTAGANGDVTFFRLPGGFRVRFTGHDVRHADGRQLQRVGIQPDILVEPTIRGIREGRDEVLERAIEYVNQVAR